MKDDDKIMHTNTLIIASFVLIIVQTSTVSAFLTLPPKRYGVCSIMSSALHAVDSPTNFVSDVIKKFNVGKISKGNGDNARDELANQPRPRTWW